MPPVTPRWLHPCCLRWRCRDPGDLLPKSSAEFWQLRHVLHAKPLFLALFFHPSLPFLLCFSLLPSSQQLLFPLPSSQTTTGPHRAQLGTRSPCSGRGRGPGPHFFPPHSAAGAVGPMLTHCSPLQASPRCEQPRSPPAPAPTCCRTGPGEGRIREVPSGTRGTGSSAPCPARRSLTVSCSPTTPSTARAARRARAAPSRLRPTSLSRRKKVPALPRGGPSQLVSSGPASLGVSRVAPFQLTGTPGVSPAPLLGPPCVCTFCSSPGLALTGSFHIPQNRSLLGSGHVPGSRTGAQALRQVPRVVLCSRPLPIP